MGGIIMLAEALEPSDPKTEGLLLVLASLAAHIPAETAPNLLKKCAEAMAAIVRELSTDELAPLLEGTVNSLCTVLCASTQAASMAVRAASTSTDPEVTAAATGVIGAVVAVTSSLGAVAATAADHFTPLAPAAVSALLPLLRARLCGTGSATVEQAMVTPALLAACLECAGPVVASAWAEGSFHSIRDEIASFARQVLVDNKVPSEVRASAHNFFSAVALASFEEFAPQLHHVVPPALQVISTVDDAEFARGNTRRAVRTAQHEERVAALSALGVYAIAVGPAFAPFLQSVLPAIRGQVRHASPDVRVAVAECLERLGRMVGGLAEKLPAGSPDRAAAAAMAMEVAHAVCELIGGCGPDGASALRRSLQVKEDLVECAGFVQLLSQEAVAALSSTGSGQRSDDIESSISDADDALEDEH